VPANADYELRAQGSHRGKRSHNLDPVTTIDVLVTVKPRLRPKYKPCWIFLAWRTNQTGKSLVPGVAASWVGADPRHFTISGNNVQSSKDGTPYDSGGGGGTAIKR